MCFRMKTDTFWYVFAYRPHRNDRKRWWKPRYMTLFSAPFSKASVFIYPRCTRNGFQKAPLLKPFSKVCVFINGRWKRIKKNAFSCENALVWSGHDMPEKFENATVTGHFGFVFKESLGRKITWLSWHHRFRKCFPSTRKRKRIAVDRRPNLRNKAAFSNSSDVVWMGPPLIPRLKPKKTGMYYVFIISW